MRAARLTVAIGFFLPLALDGAALAERAPTGEIVAFELPGFVTIDRASQESFGEVTAGVSFFEGDDPDFNVRVDLYGQYLTPIGAGGYASLPISFLAEGEDSETAFGNVELGALHNLRASPRTAIALRGGLMLATADDDFEGALANGATSYARHTDLIANIADTTWVRLAISPTHRSGQFFFRLDAGIDLAVDEPAGAEIDPIARFNLGLGFTNGAVALMGELVSLRPTGEDGEFRHSAAVSVRGGMGGGVQGYGAVVVPVDEESVPFAVDLVLIAGMRIPIEN